MAGVAFRTVISFSGGRLVAMDKHDEYQERAQYCQQMAETAHTEGLRANWLALAEKWLNMAAMKQENTAALVSLLRPDWQRKS